MSTVCDLPNSRARPKYQIPSGLQPNPRWKLFLFIFCWSILHRTNFQDNSALISTENPCYFYFSRFLRLPSPLPPPPPSTTKSTSINSLWSSSVPRYSSRLPFIIRIFMALPAITTLAPCFSHDAIYKLLKCTALQNGQTTIQHGKNGAHSVRELRTRRALTTRWRSRDKAATEELYYV